MQEYSLSENTISELFYLRKMVDYEIYKRKDEIADIKSQKFYHRQRMLNDAKKLIIHLENKLGFKFIIDSRKQLFTNSRFILMQYFREKGMKLEDIASIFERDHSTVITNIRKFKDLQETEDFFFMGLYDKITNLIKEYNELNTI